MTTSQLNDRIAELKELSSNPEFLPTYIEVEYIQRAIDLLQIRAQTTPQFFRLMTSLNLLNAAIKLPAYKKELSYALIKGKASGILNALVKDNFAKQVEATCTFSRKEKCAYVRVLGLQFSFHNLKMTDAMNAYIDSDRNGSDTWEGVRLQRIAKELLDISLAYNPVSE